MLAAEQPPRNDVDAVILGHGPARTLYRARQPVCRSLDGILPLGAKAARCCDMCEQKHECTAQIRLELVIDNTPYRLLLAFTSAKNFISYVLALRRKGDRIEELRTRLLVLPRRGWGEVQFRSLP